MSATALPTPGSDEHWALFLDIDGTLFDLVDDPTLVEADQALLELLDDLSRCLGGALALISGRDLRSIDRIMAPRRYPAAGTHGAEWRLSDGGCWIMDIDAAALATAAGDLERFVATCPGVMLERKAQSLALHYRLRPQAEEQVAAAAAAMLRQLGNGYRLMPGKAVVEIAPAGADKGAAIARFLDCPPFRGRRPVFAGDDLTDEHGFEVVNQRNGLSIRVGPATGTNACCHTPTPAALRHWLGGSRLRALQERLGMETPGAERIGVTPGLSAGGFPAEMGGIGALSVVAIQDDRRPGKGGECTIS